VNQTKYITAMLAAGGSLAFAGAADAWIVEPFNTPITADAYAAAGEVTLAGASAPQFLYGAWANLPNFGTSGLAPDDGGLINGEIFTGVKTGVELGESSSLGVLSPVQWNNALKGSDPALTFKAPPNYLPANGLLTVTNGGDATLSGGDQYIYLVFITDVGAGAEYFGTAHVNAAGTLETVTYAPIPEPEAWALMVAGVGLAGAGLRRRRRQVSANA
jgi:hypothetical protein